MADELKGAEKYAFEHFLSMYKHQWDLNSYYRENYDTDLEYYLSYRDKDRYPMAYNNSYNLLLARIYSTLSRMMEHLYQGGPNDLVGVRPRKRTDVDRAPRVKGLLQFQLETLNNIDKSGGSYLFNFQWLFNALTFGKGITKLYWRKEERVAPLRQTIPVPIFDGMGRVVGVQPHSVIVEAPQVVYNGPYAEVIHNKMFVPHPHYRDIQLMPSVHVVYKRSLDYVHSMAQKGIYKIENLEKLGWNSKDNVRDGPQNVGGDSNEAIAKSIGIEGALTFAQMESDRSSPEIDVIESYGKFIFPEDEAPYEVGSGTKIKGPETEAIVHIGNYKTILSIQKNRYGYRPFFDMGAYYHPELYWDYGIIKLGRDIQESYNVLANTRLQNALMSVHQMLKVRADADIDPEALIWKPFGIVPVEEMTDVEPLIIPDQTQTGVFREQEEFLENVISDITGVYPYNMGATPSRQEHVGTIYSLQSMGEARSKLLLMTMDYQGFQPFLRYMMLLNTWHLPEPFEARINTPQGETFSPLFSGDIHPEYDFTLRYTAMEPALGKQFRAQQLLQLAQIWQQDPSVQQYEWKKAILELMDLHDTEKYLKRPEQLAQEQQQIAMQAAQAELAGAAIQDELAKRQAGYEAHRDVVKGLLK
jgi:hypothetical protein